jgi:hypothetical protein
MLAIWFWGPLGLWLAWLGRHRNGVACGAFAVSVGMSLLVALAHDDVGIHTVGPIHYSEIVVPLALLSTGGVLHALQWFRQLEIKLLAPSSALLGYASALGFFILQYSGSLRLQGEFLDFPYALLRDHDVHNALVLVPPPAMRDAIMGNSVGSWQLREPFPDPFLKDDILFPNWRANVGELHARLPERDIYRIEVGRGKTRLVKLDPKNPDGPPAAVLWRRGQ